MYCVSQEKQYTQPQAVSNEFARRALNYRDRRRVRSARNSSAMLVRDNRTNSANGACGRHERHESEGMRLVTAASG